jgi:hypothetical protein
VLVTPVTVVDWLPEVVLVALASRVTLSAAGVVALAVAALLFQLL